MNRLRLCVMLSALLQPAAGFQEQRPDHNMERKAAEFSAKLDSLIAQGQYARAEQLASGGDPGAAYFLLGKIYFQHELWQRSAESLEKSLEIRGANPEVHQLLGLDWRELHRPDEAEAELLEAAKENPSSQVNQYLAGHQLILNGKFDAALPHLYATLESKPLRSQALQAVALAHARLGNYGLAESYYRKLIDSTDSSEEERYPALVNLGVLLLLGHDRGRLEEGLGCAQRAEKLRPDSSDAHFLAGKALFKLERLEEAGSELSRAAKLNPGDSKPHFLLARIYDQLGQPDRARKERQSLSRIQNRRGQPGMAAVNPMPVTPN